MNKPAEVQRRLLALQYHARLPPRDANFHWPSSAQLLEIQEHLVEDLGLASRTKLGEEDDGEVDISYERAFLKQLIFRLEEAVDSSNISDQEIHGPLLEAYALLMSRTVPLTTAPFTRPVSYLFPDGDLKSIVQSVQSLFSGWSQVSIVENASTIARGTTGLKTWEASLRLAAHLMAQPSESWPAGLRILELGSGAGLLGTLTAIRARGSQIYLTDLDGPVLHTLQQTVDRSEQMIHRQCAVSRRLTHSLTHGASADLSTPHNATVHSLDWLDAQSTDSEGHRLIFDFAPQLIIGADIVYDPELLPALCQVIQLALRSSADLSSAAKGTEDTHRVPHALIASTIRNRETYSAFLTALGEPLSAAHFIFNTIGSFLTGLLPSYISSEECGLHSQQEKLARPLVNLLTGALVERPWEEGHIQLFPSGHVPEKEGMVELLKITLVP